MAPGSPTTSRSARTASSARRSSCDRAFDCCPHVNVTGVTTIGERTVVHPFASLGSPPQSLGYRGGATRLVVGADCVHPRKRHHEHRHRRRRRHHHGRRPRVLHGLCACRPRLPRRQRRHLRQQRHARRSHRDRRSRLHRRAGGHPPVHACRRARHDQRPDRGSRRRHSLRHCRRNVLAACPASMSSACGGGSSQTRPFAWFAPPITGCSPAKARRRIVSMRSKRNSAATKRSRRSSPSFARRGNRPLCMPGDHKQD